METSAAAQLLDLSSLLLALEYHCVRSLEPRDYCCYSNSSIPVCNFRKCVVHFPLDVYRNFTSGYFSKNLKKLVDLYLILLSLPH